MWDKPELTPEQRIAMDKSTIEIIRCIFRPILIFCLMLGAFYFIANDYDTEFARWWVTIFLGGGCEWVLERPIIKIIGGLKNNGR